MIRWSLKKERPKVVVPTLAKTCNQLFCCQLITPPPSPPKNIHIYINDILCYGFGTCLSLKGYKQYLRQVK